MNKTAIKNFAIWARNKLIAGISYRAGLMGITAEGIQKALPQSTGTTEFYDIGTAEPYSISGTEVKQREKLVELIRRKEKETNYKTAYKYVLEEVAYTWFNRLIAVRFMEVNDYLPSRVRVLSSDSGKTEPDLLTNPFDAELPFTEAEQQEIIRLKQENKSDDAFRLLFIKQCNALNEILPALFEKTSDYTELLLNLSVIDQDGVIWHLVHDIPEEDFDVKRGGQVEIIGWLYQYYNTEPKNEAFGKKGKISKEEIPAVTQLFTPDWIVRYMVENSLGRLWIEHLRAIDESVDEFTLAAAFGWKYYLPEAKQELEVETELRELRKERASLTPEQITIIDPCMGSGHILVYAFDVLMQIYESAGYGQRDAAGSILEHNLYGLDIDDRAFQLAYFAVMMKARQYNRRILNGEHKLNVYSILESNGISDVVLEDMGASLNEEDCRKAKKEARALISEFKDAKEYGSILNIKNRDWDLLRRFALTNDSLGQLSLDMNGSRSAADRLQVIINIAEIMSNTYFTTCTNPPYMGLKQGMSIKQVDYVKKNYPDSKHDMFAVFIERCMSYTKASMYQAMITQHSWMFLSSYENLRIRLSNSNTLNMSHLGPRAFEEIAGEVVQTTAFINRKLHVKNYRGIYCRLIDAKSEKGKEEAFLEGDNRFITNENQFEVIPGMPRAYWISSALVEDFRKGITFSDIGFPRVGMQTSNNEKFLRIWYEIKYDEFSAGEKKWIKYIKGGPYRKWYGNLDYVLWYNNSPTFITSNQKNARVLSEEELEMEKVTWTDLATSRYSSRVAPIDSFHDISGHCYYPTHENYYYLLGFTNSIVFQEIIDLLNSSLHYQVGDVARTPVIMLERESVSRWAKENVSLAKADWDSFETSWDFESHPLTKKGLSHSHWNAESVTVEACFRAWSDECDRRFEELKANEEEINRIFIDIYGLQDELIPEVEDKDITVRRADLKRDIKSLLSYAVGCMFGRYSLDTAGLAYAGGTWNEQKYEKFKPDGDNVIPITDEEYLEDDIVSRLCEFLKVVYGEEKLEDNLDFIAKALGNKGDSSREIIRNYFLNDFFKDHCQTYSVTGSGKRPIYWLFDSGKSNGFKALIYLHRYNADTIGNLRIDYLHRIQRIYESEMSRMQDMIDHSTNAREVAQATKRREKLAKQLKECREYDEKLAHLALSRIDLDLDDGVKKNYRKIQTASDGKFYEVLADSVNIMSKE